MQIEKNYGTETSQLNPPHRFVPWVIVNNQPLEEARLQFMHFTLQIYICVCVCVNLADQSIALICPFLQDFNNFLSYVCKAYIGNPRPEACGSFVMSTMDVNDEMESAHPPVCYAH